jgi:hypothetical protein
MAAALPSISVTRERSSGAESFGEASGSIDAVFGTGESGLPMWFNPERFLEPEFDAADYVADLRRSVGLPCSSFSHVAGVERDYMPMLHHEIKPLHHHVRPLHLEIKPLHHHFRPLHHEFKTAT